MTKRRARLYLLLLFMAALGLAATFTLLALKDNLSYFRTPTEIVSGNYPEHNSARNIRLGGLVEKGSLRHEGDAIIFSVTDLTNAVTVRYSGIIPDLFREGQGVVVEGHMNDQNIFAASTLLAKHDERYQPPEVTKALKQSGKVE
jgi:cytochrome c-type biogenesis protein CcmE